MAELNLKTLTRKIDLLTLRLFLTLDEERHLGRSAIRENIAPSAVTKRMQDFEEMIGLELFHRGPKGVEPTPVGRVVAHRVRDIFASLESMRREIDDFVGGVRGHIRICTTESIITEFLADEIGDFVQSFPNVIVDLVEERNRAVIQAGLDGTADVVIYALTKDIDDSGIDSLPYRTDNLVAVLPRNHPLSAKSSIAFEQLLDSDFIGLSPNTSLMMQLRHAAQKAGGELKVKYEVASNEAARSLVRAGLGVMVQPDGLVMFSDPGRICAVQLTEAWAVRHLRAGIPKRRLAITAARTFLRQLTNPAHLDFGEMTLG